MIEDVDVSAWIILKILLEAIIEKLGWDSLTLILGGSTKTKTSEEVVCKVKHGRRTQSFMKRKRKIIF